MYQKNSLHTISNQSSLHDAKHLKLGATPGTPSHNYRQSSSVRHGNASRSRLGGFRESGFQELTELNAIRYDQSLDPNTKKNMIQSIKRSFGLHSQQCSSAEVVLGLINCLNGPNHFLMGIQFRESGFITVILANLFLGFVLGKTADLTQRHAKLSENEYMVTIKRILGKTWEKIYFIASVLNLWTVSIVFVLTGCDAIYSAIKLIDDGTVYPDQGTPTFDRFSYQYVGLIFLAIELLLIIPKNLAWLFRITSYATYCTFFGIIFVIIAGIYELSQGAPEFIVSGSPRQGVLTLFGNLSFTDTIYAIGFFETSYQVHNEVVNLLRTSKHQEKNARNVFIAYRVLQCMYLTTGILGAFILANRDFGSINTLLSVFNSSDPGFIYVLALINQILLGLQTMVLAAVILFIFRSQMFTLILGEEKAPPEWAYHAMNVGVLITIYIAEIFNYQPATAMALSGAFFGLIIMYIVPIVLHLKCLNVQNKREANQQLLSKSEADISLASFVTKQNSKVPKPVINTIYVLLMVQGVVTFIGVVIYLFTSHDD